MPYMLLCANALLLIILFYPTILFTYITSSYINFSPLIHNDMQQVPTTRRAAARQNDENAQPTRAAQSVRNKPSLSNLGPAAKAAGAASAPAAAGKKAAPVKAGAKRTALGGVVGNGIKEDVEEDTKKSG